MALSFKFFFQQHLETIRQREASAVEYCRNATLTNELAAHLLWNESNANYIVSVLFLCMLTFWVFLPLDEAIASRAVFVIVSR